MIEETKLCRLYPSDIEILYGIASKRFTNRSTTHESTIPTPAKILHLLLRHHKIKEVILKEICLLPAREDLVNEIQE